MQIASAYLLHASDNTGLEGGYDGYMLGEKKWRWIHLTDYVNIFPFTDDGL